MPRRRSPVNKKIVSGRTGRRPGPSTTREEILAAARERFAKRGYDGTSLREIAERAGVDPALVRRFFGSKEGLLVEIIRYTLSLWEQAPAREMLVAMLRSACTNERAAKLLRDFFAGQILARIAGAVSDKDAQLRASAVGSQIVGLAFYRYVLKVEPIASASPETLRTTFGPTLQRYLTGPLTPPRRRKAK